MTALRLHKRALRAQARTRRAALTPRAARQAGERIQRAVLRLPEWAAARRVCLYLALPGEVQTGRLRAACRRAGVEVWVPAYDPRSRAYRPAVLAPGARLTAGPHGVAEPARPAWVCPGARADVALVPGAAFDRAGGRLGRGGGHYDRLLAGAPLRRAWKAGLAFACQVVGRVPMGARDVRLDAVITETGVCRRSAPGSGENETCHHAMPCPARRGRRTRS